MKNIQKLLYWSAVVLASGCSTEPKPEPIRVGEDICANCRMAIIEPQFASEIVQAGDVLKYDDLACLVSGAKNLANAKPQEIFVQDYYTREWISREQAFVARGSTVQTPMGSGALAFASREAAEKFMAENGGQLMSLQDFLNREGAKNAKESEM